MLRISGLLLLLWSSVRSSYALHLAVTIHYPHKHSAVEYCGFKFVVEAASATDPASTIAHASAQHRGNDTFMAYLTLPDKYLYAEAVVAVMAEHDGGKIIWDKKCMATCPYVSPQGRLANVGPFAKTQPLAPLNVLDVWPDFACQTWSTHRVSFASSAIGRQVDARVRVPAAQRENAVPRPSHKLPPVMFRLNAEWYWDRPGEDYDFWHSLMVNGEMEPVVVVEVYIKGIDWQDWDHQPVYTTEPLHKKCGRCEVELQFICDRWEAGTYATYKGGNHSFNQAPAFFEELWKMVMPHVFRELPNRTDSKAVRAGMWGYCIGGLGAWSAITAHPHLYNIAYLGSPAMDYDCGDPFKAVHSMSLNSYSLRPKIYIDSGADEGDEMTVQTALLFRKLQDRGFEEGRDVFYYRAPFGTHQSRAFLRRAMRGLLVMFGSGNPRKETHDAGLQLLSTVPNAARLPPLPSWALTGAIAIASFIAGRVMQIRTGMAAKFFQGAKETLLGA